MDRDVGLPIGVEHFRVLGARGKEIELETDALAALSDGIAAPPAEVIDGSDEHVAQAAVLAVYAPALEPRRAPAFDSSSQLHVKSFLVGVHGQVRGQELIVIKSVAALGICPRRPGKGLMKSRRHSVSLVRMFPSRPASGLLDNALRAVCLVFCSLRGSRVLLSTSSGICRECAASSSRQRTLRSSPSAACVPRSPRLRPPRSVTRGFCRRSSVRTRGVVRKRFRWARPPRYPSPAAAVPPRQLTSSRVGAARRAPAVLQLCRGFRR